MNKTNITLWLIVCLSIFTRFFQPVSRLAYDHDSDLSAWIVKDIVIDHHLRLIGQLTSSPGLFIGPYFYYLLIPFFLLAKMDPIGTIFIPPMLGIVGVLSTFHVLKKVFSKAHALFGSAIYAGSFLLATTERQVVPTMFIYLWSIWFFYAIHQISKKYPSGLLLSAVLLALAWHIQFILAIASLLIAAIFIVKIRSFKILHFFLPTLVFLVLSAPLILFEIRHSAMQTKALFFTFGTTHEQVVRTRTEKLVHVLGLAAKNANAIFWQRPEKVPLFALPVTLVLWIAFLIKKKKIPWDIYLILLGWFVLFTGFFVLHPINLSEYYLNSLNVIWVILGTVALVSWRKMGLVLLVIFVTHHLFLVINLPVNHSGYVNRKQMVAYIQKDAASRRYPCIAISYMTDPGYNLGYRYLFWQEQMHVNRPDSNSPVYTIVFPHFRANRLDYTSGALGLVLPDYSRYTPDEVKSSCSGQNSNLTDPMFEFTK